VIAADKDYRPISEKEEYTVKIPKAEMVIIKNSRHATPMERPNQFNQALMLFLSRQLQK
jgi:pimeloyl-ACP methyl ester carboxylesterase